MKAWKREVKNRGDTIKDGSVSKKKVVQFFRSWRILAIGMNNAIVEQIVNSSESLGSNFSSLSSFPSDREISLRENRKFVYDKWKRSERNVPPVSSLILILIPLFLFLWIIHEDTVKKFSFLLLILYTIMIQILFEFIFIKSWKYIKKFIIGRKFEKVR